MIGPLLIAFDRNLPHRRIERPDFFPVDRRKAIKGSNAIDNKAANN
jgi:hypothetical protein